MVAEQVLPLQVRVELGAVLLWLQREIRSCHGKSWWTQETLYNYPKVYLLLQIVGSYREKEHKETEMTVLARPRKTTYPCEKKWADKDHELFPGFNMVVHWVLSSLRFSLECTLKNGACKLSSPYIFVAGL